MKPSKKDWRDLERCARQILELYGLTHWRMEVSREPSDHCADVEFAGGLRSFELHVSDEFWALPPEDRPERIAHEMGHVMARPLALIVEALCKSLGDSGKRDMQIYEDAEEGVIDSQAIGLRPVLPEWGDKS